MNPGVSGMADLPRQRFEEVIAADFDVGRNEVGDRRQRAAKHYVFSGSFQIVVDDLVRPGSIPATYCLCVEADAMYVGDVRICYRGFRAVQTDAALNGLGCKSVNPQTVQYQVMRC